MNAANAKNHAHEPARVNNGNNKGNGAATAPDITQYPRGMGTGKHPCKIQYPYAFKNSPAHNVSL